ncbi:MAG: hypothetical protein WHT06_16125 [Desulfobacterales bacterium]
MPAQAKTLRLPHRFEPRAYQLPVLSAMDRGIKRAVLVWHRRAGKDKTAFNYLVKRAVERVGNYYYYFPTFNQGRKILWEGIDKDGLKTLEHVPKPLIAKKNDAEMRLELANGSNIRVIGTDRSEVVGPNPVGCVFSEYSLQDPNAWNLVRPILLENDGWAIFCYTPRGMNHGYDLWQTAQANPKDWFCQLLTIDDTRDHAGNPIITREQYEAEIRDGMEEDLARQEFYCSWKAPRTGAIYARILEEIDQAKQIGNVPWDPSLPVHTAWDLGMDDATAIWFVQPAGRETRLIDYYENSGVGIEHYAKIVSEKPYTYGRHFAPHDIEVRELGTGTSRKETAARLGLKFDIAPRLSPADGIQAVRVMLRSTWIDTQKCSRGLHALRSYHYRYDEKRRVFSSEPDHDWSSHAADALRYFATAYPRFVEATKWTPKIKTAKTWMAA